MAHANINERRVYVKRLLRKGTPLNRIKEKASLKFSCHVAAIDADVRKIKNTYNFNNNKTKKFKLSVFERDENTCQYCGCKDKYLIAEHVIPEYHKGTLVYENIVAACVSCNTIKCREIWIPINFNSISSFNKDHYDYVINNATKDFRQ